MAYVFSNSRFSNKPTFILFNACCYLADSDTVVCLSESGNRIFTGRVVRKITIVITITASLMHLGNASAASLARERK